LKTKIESACTPYEVTRSSKELGRLSRMSPRWLPIYYSVTRNYISGLAVLCVNKPTLARELKVSESEEILDAESLRLQK